MRRGTRASPVEDVNDRAGQWAVALDHMQRALAILDKSNAPPEIGAELDLAINRLRHTVDKGSEAI